MIAGFRLLGLLGEGGFGLVYRAEDTTLHRKIALEDSERRSAGTTQRRETFLREARALASVQHDHVVPIFQIGEENGLLYLAMPLLGGETLATRLEREGALPPAEVCRIGREISDGLAAIHAKGLIHRDLKPANIWLEAGTGRVKVLDLGLAHDPLAVAKEGSIAGTPAYMSPEQAEGEELDFRSDLFSLGTVLYECATGRRAFAKLSALDTLRAIREEEPPVPAKANPAVPVELSEVIESLQRKNPTNRPVSSRAVSDLLKNCEIQALGPAINKPSRLWPKLAMAAARPRCHRPSDLAGYTPESGQSAYELERCSRGNRGTPHPRFRHNAFRPRGGWHKGRKSRHLRQDHLGRKAARSGETAPDAHAPRVHIPDCIPARWRHGTLFPGEREDRAALIVRGQVSIHRESRQGIWTQRVARLVDLYGRRFGNSATSLPGMAKDSQTSHADANVWINGWFAGG